MKNMPNPNPNTASENFRSSDIGILANATLARSRYEMMYIKKTNGRIRHAIFLRTATCEIASWGSLITISDGVRLQAIQPSPSTACDLSQKPCGFGQRLGWKGLVCAIP